MRLNPEALLDAKILIVDDQEANVRLLQRLLLDAGYRSVSSTQASQDVGALYRTHAHDLILLDLQMPGMDGFEVMQQLQQQAPDEDMPVIVLTAQPAHKLRALQAGAKDFISKPFDLLEVKTRIVNMLELRLLYKQLARHNADLERTVQERTAALRDSEERFRRLTELSSDWYWEQNANGDFTHVSGPVLETLGIGMAAFLAPSGTDPAAGWDPAERAALHAKLDARQPFLDFVFCRIDSQGRRRQYRVSGEPMFDSTCRFLGYRGIGAEVLAGGAGTAPAQPARQPSGAPARAGLMQG